VEHREVERTIRQKSDDLDMQQVQEELDKVRDGCVVCWLVSDDVETGE
jgi:hypothetical protein